MRNSMLCLWLLSMLLLYEVKCSRFNFYIDHSPSDKTIQYCTCIGNCNDNNTLFGLVYGNICYHLVSEELPFYPMIHSRPLSLLSSTFVDVVHMLTWQMFKLTDTSHIRLQIGKVSDTMLRLPSLPIHTLNCPIYDIETNILLDDVYCQRRYEIFESLPTLYNKVAVKVDMNKFIDSYTNDTGCLSFKYSDAVEEYVQINSQEKYNQMCNIVFKEAKISRNWFYKHSAFIINYNPTNISLTNEYFMHIPDHTYYKSPNGCHIVVPKVGKIFQQPSCEDAERVYKKNILQKMRATRLIEDC